MSQWLTMGTTLQCMFGMAPAPLVVLPDNRVMACNMPVATIMDNKPIVNITPFVMCISPTNPEVIAVKVASLGAVEMAPCVPATVAPWIPGAPNVMAGSMPAITMESKLMCMWEGLIQPVAPGQATVMAG